MNSLPWLPEAIALVISVAGFTLTIVLIDYLVSRREKRVK